MGFLPNQDDSKTQQLLSRDLFGYKQNFCFNFPRKRDYIWPDSSTVQKKMFSEPLKNAFKAGKNGTETIHSCFPPCKRRFSMSKNFAKEISKEKDKKNDLKAMFNTQVEKPKLEKRKSNESCKSSNSIESSSSSKKEITNKSKTFINADNCFSNQHFTFRAEINSRPMDLTYVK